MRTDRIQNNTSYSVSISGQKYDRELLQAILQSTQGKRANPVSKRDVKKTIAPELQDGGKVTDMERRTLAFARRHTRWTPAANAALDKVLGKFAGQGLESSVAYEKVTDLLERQGRLADFYAVKTTMSPADLTRTWKQGITGDELNRRLKQALTPVPFDVIKKTFADWEIADVLKTFSAAELARVKDGKMSLGEFQNLIYRSWEQQDPGTKGLTPYDASYKATFKPISLF